VRRDPDYDLDHDQCDQDDQDDTHDNDNDNGYDVPEWVADSQRIRTQRRDVPLWNYPPPHWEQGTGGGLNKRLVGVAIAGRGAALRSVPKDRKDQEGEEEYAYSWAVAKWTDESAQEVAGRVQEFYGALEREARDRRSRARVGEEAGRGTMRRMGWSVGLWRLSRLSYLLCFTIGGVSGSYFLLGRWVDWGCCQIVLPADVG
jgi:hypothetical protein